MQVRSLVSACFCGWFCWDCQGTLQSWQRMTSILSSCCTFPVLQWHVECLLQAEDEKPAKRQKIVEEKSQPLLAGPLEMSQVQSDSTYDQNVNMNVHQNLFTSLLAFSGGSFLIHCVSVHASQAVRHLQAIEYIDDEIVLLLLLRVVFHLERCFYDGNVIMRFTLLVFAFFTSKHENLVQTTQSAYVAGKW